VLGAVQTIAKPFTLEKMLDIVNKELRRWMDRREVGLPRRGTSSQYVADDPAPVVGNTSLAVACRYRDYDRLR
jgi:hypothetical protein